MSTLGTPAAAQSSPPPDVAVTVDGLPLDVGDVHHTSADPWMSVTVTAPEGETVRLVEVRVDGETRHVFEPSTRRTDRNVVLDLSNGEHRITVVAKAGTTETYAATIVRDDRAPTVTFDQPLRGMPVSYGTDTLERLGTQRPTFLVDGAPVSTLPDVQTLTVSNSTLTIAGSIEDDSEIRAVRIEHAYEYAAVGGRMPGSTDFAYDPVDRVPIHPGISLPRDNVDGDAYPERVDTYFSSSPGDSFNRTVTLALGANYFRITVEDALGNVAVEHVVVTVEDGTGPTLNVTDVRYVSKTRLHIEGTVRDEVQVHDVWLEETLVTLDDIEADVDLEALDGSDICTAADTLDFDDEETLCSVYSGATVYVREDIDALIVRHRLIFRKPTVPDADRKRIRFDTTVYHPPEADRFVMGTNDTALNPRYRSYTLATFLAPNVTVADSRTGYVDENTVTVSGRVVDGQVREVSVETVDPTTGRIVDIDPVDLGTNGSFTTRLAATPDETQVRVRARDASGAEYVTNATVSGPLEPTTTPAGDGDDGADADTGVESNAGGDDAAVTNSTANDTAAGGVRIPVVDVVIPVPSVGIPDALGASVSAPLPVVGPVDIPLIAGVPLLLVVAVAGARARSG
ncbi:hypothetical protein [Haloplanus aerogenes]|uniref:Uncharacterized protein n=1 Tax=Haloplanus aerogenes TaxID=660522 RepID=A0A3M0DPQ5_9EURY|nr:hypothetical protein [Haloplanus aerogenes]AZH24564.1 hypothetical protein DU502_03825 [Haloplanus aerogenes]RMB23781.1 hypothetical protein ATH50_1011 [Haloplanus aerogenes]